MKQKNQKIHFCVQKTFPGWLAALVLWNIFSVCVLSTFWDHWATDFVKVTRELIPPINAVIGGISALKVTIYDAFGIIVRLRVIYLKWRQDNVVFLTALVVAEYSTLFDPQPLLAKLANFRIRAA